MDFCAHSDALWFRVSAHFLLYSYGVGIDIECVLGELPGDAWHVGWFSCKYLPALTEELDEHAFLCIGKGLRHIDGFRRILRVELHLLCLLNGVEFIGCDRPSVR